MRRMMTSYRLRRIRPEFLRSEVLQTLRKRLSSSEELKREKVGSDFRKVPTVAECEPKIDLSDDAHPGSYKKLRVRHDCQPEIGIPASTSARVGAMITATP
jgi:hypothetical protein